MERANGDDSTMVPPSACRLETESLPRVGFHIDLTEDQYTVSWKELNKMIPSTVSASNTMPPAPEPSFKGISSSRAADQMRGVIARIDRMYNGNDNNDEDNGRGESLSDSSESDGEGDVPEDRYDTDDSFIDDEELDDYLEAQPAKGFFISRVNEDLPIEDKEIESEPTEKNRNNERKPGGKKSKITRTRTLKSTSRQTIDGVNGDETVEKTPSSKTKCKRKRAQDDQESNEEKPTMAHDQPIKAERLEVKRLPNPKVSPLDKVVQSLEEEVRERCPSTTDRVLHDSIYQLPKEVTQKLIRAAKLADKLNKLTDDFYDILVSIVGHVIDLKTLKHDLEEMVELAKTDEVEKQAMLNNIKQELTQMIADRVSGSKGFTWDADVENLLYDLQKSFVNRGTYDTRAVPLTKKFYAELVELWPEGIMDLDSIKAAISRAKERQNLTKSSARKKKARREIMEPESTVNPDSAKETNAAEFKQTEVGDKDHDIGSPAKRSSTNPKLSSLEKAIQALEKEVTLRCPPSMSTLDKNNDELPKEVKQKLATVAKLADKQNKLSDELYGKLVTILGHMMNADTLKMNIQNMVELEETTQVERQTKLNDIKEDLADMIASRLSSSVNQTEFAWDSNLENRLLDYQQVYSPRIKALPKKFYVELVELWPKGLMDKDTIMAAIARATERRKNAREQEKIEMKKRKAQTDAQKPRKKLNGNLTPSVEQRQSPGSKEENEEQLNILNPVRANEDGGKLNCSSAEDLNPDNEENVVIRTESSALLQHTEDLDDTPPANNSDNAVQ